MNQAVRHPFNSNLHVMHINDYWGDLPILSEPQGLINEYLVSIQSVMDSALAKHPRTLMIRFDLRYPFQQRAHCASDISRFISSFKAQIKADLKHKKSIGQRVHPCNISYCWAKEQVSADLPHYHVAVFLNFDCYHTLGDYNAMSNVIDWNPHFNERVSNTASRIIRAWASAIQMHEWAVRGLVHFPDNAVYKISKDDADSYARAFCRLSYLAKVESKCFNDGMRWFQTSRL